MSVAVEEACQALHEFGFVVLPEVIPLELVREINQRVEQLFDLEGDAAGAEFKQEVGCRRLANLVNKGSVFQGVIAHDFVLPLVGHVLGDDFKLSSLNVRSVNPHGVIRQPLHADMAAIADAGGSWVCNVVWMLQDVTLENGPIRVVPGSHRIGRLPHQAMEDPMADHPQQVWLTGKVGTLVVFNAHLWHGGGVNRSSEPRVAMHAFYCRRDKPQQQYQKKLLDPHVQASLSPRLRQILALDDPENDRLSSQVATTSGFMK